MVRSPESPLPPGEGWVRGAQAGPPSPRPSPRGSDDAPPILTVRNLQTHFFGREGVVRAVDGVDLDVYAGRTLGVVGESGCGKSVTARSILGIVERPGRVVAGSIVLRRENGSTDDLARLPPDSAVMRAIRGREIALVFQEPMASFSQYYTVGNQITESIRLHTRA